MRRKKPVVSTKATGWNVVVTPARELGRYYYDYHGDNTTLTEGIIAVRLRYNNKDRMTYGTVEIKDEEFHEKVTTLKAEALEKASALEAVGAA